MNPKKKRKADSQKTGTVVLSRIMNNDQNHFNYSGSQPGPSEEARSPELTSAAEAGFPGAPADAQAPRPWCGGVWRNLYRNLRGGLRIALFLKATPEEICGTPGGLALLAACDFLCNLAVSFLLVGRSGGFAYSAIPGFFFHLPLLLFAGYLAGRLLSRPSLGCALAVALVSLSIPIELSHALLERLALLRQLEWLQPYLDAPHYYRFYGWWALAAIWFLLRLPAPRLTRRLDAGLLFVLIVVVPLWFFSRADLWVSAGQNGSESGELQLNEKVLAAQARLLDGQLAGLIPGEARRSHFYFVGFAGDATQDVFLKEVLAAQQVFERRFGTAGRSIVLANNPQTASSLPFASVTNLDYALQRLGQVMNRDSDVLVLFLTSHGSRDHELEVSNPPLDLDQVTPELVRKMLQRSGIKWRVLVVSACFSGGFIDPVKDEQTLIITAADAKSESFGCGFGEKFTWFGEAFLDRGLKSSFSFTEAFIKARGTIRKWEEEQGETPSNPQIWVGREIGKKLKSMEPELRKSQRNQER